MPIELSNAVILIDYDFDLFQRTGLASNKLRAFIPSPLLIIDEFAG